MGIRTQTFGLVVTRRHISRLTVAALAPALLLGGLASPAESAVMVRGKSGHEAVISTKFNSLSAGRINAAGFRSAMGYANTDEINYDDSHVVSDGSTKKNSYRVQFDANTYKGSSGNNGVNVFVPLGRTMTNGCVRYDVKFESDFDWSLGGKLPGLGGVAPGVSPSVPTGGGNPGSNGWSARIMWLTPKAYSFAGPINQAVSYFYGPKQKSHWGDNLQMKRSFVAGQWHRIRQCFVMNRVGSADGHHKAWFDKTLVYSNSTTTFRNRDDVGINYLYWSVFRGGGTKDWAGKNTSGVRLDNLRVIERP